MRKNKLIIMMAIIFALSCIVFPACGKADNYTITYELNGGTNNVLNPNTYTSDSENITLQSPTKNGYTFVKWTEGNTKKKEVQAIKPLLLNGQRQHME